MKKVIYPLLFLIFSLLTTCSNNNEPELSLEGEWKIVERRFECNMEEYEKYVTNYFSAAKENGDVYNLSIGTYNPSTNKGSYLEESFVNTDGTLIRDKFLNGEYKPSQDKKTMTIILPTSRGNWTFDTRIADHNQNIIFFEQAMESSDVENMYLLYFGIIRHMDDGIIGTLRTKAVRIKE